MSVDRGGRRPDLVLLPWDEGDATALARAVEESLEHLRPWMPWAVEAPDAVERRLAWIRRANASGADRVFGCWHEGRVVGECGLHARIDAGGIEISYWTHAAFTGRGVATEMARRMVELAYDDPSISFVEIRHNAANPASGRIAARLGFELVGRRRCQPLAPGESDVLRIWRLSAERRVDDPTAQTP